MRIYRHFDDIAPEHQGGVIAIGNFDGVHRGHQAVIQEAGRIAKANGAPWGVLTFEPHPRMMFTPETPPFRITPFVDKSRIIEEMGVDFLVVLHFDQALSRLPADEFVTKVLVDGLHARHIVSGFDFVFGHQRQGTARFLESEGKKYGFGATGAGKVVDETGEVISSTRIRAFLAEGKPREAARLIGRPFEIAGRVSGGDQRGRTMGFPTANLMLSARRPPSPPSAFMRCVRESRWTRPPFGMTAWPIWAIDPPSAEPPPFSKPIFSISPRISTASTCAWP
jgi:riboflavin kinase/FMN adenylyltransferase